MLAVAVAQLIFELEVFFHQASLAKGDGFMQAEELGDQHGDHGEKADVFLKRDLRAEQSVHGKDAHRRLGQHDRYADEGNLSLGKIGPGAGPVQEKRFAVDVRHHEGVGGLEDAADHPLAQPVDAASLLFFAETVGGGNGELLAAFFLENQGGSLHAQGFVQDP